MACLLSLLHSGDQEQAICLLLDTPSMVDSNSQHQDDKHTPLFYACCHGNLLLVELLLLQGAEVDLKCTLSGSRPLHVASDYGHTDIVRLLLQHGANVNSKTENGDTAAHFAAYRGHLATVAVLRAFGVDVSVKNLRHCTPEDEARSNDHSKVISYLKKLRRSKKEVTDTSYPVLVNCHIELCRTSS